jgi:hypothetical protein
MGWYQLLSPEARISLNDHRPSAILQQPGRQKAPPARDVRAADLQAEPTERVENRAEFFDPNRFVGSDEDGGSPANIASERASH